jgi:hypothetical protein
MLLRGEVVHVRLPNPNVFQASVNEDNRITMPPDDVVEIRAVNMEGVHERSL